MLTDGLTAIRHTKKEPKDVKSFLEQIFKLVIWFERL